MGGAVVLVVSLNISRELFSCLCPHITVIPTCLCSDGARPSWRICRIGVATRTGGQEEIKLALLLNLAPWGGDGCGGLCHRLMYFFSHGNINKKATVWGGENYVNTVVSYIS